MAGPLYMAAVYTGLRRSELAKLEWGDVDLDGPQPQLRVRASTTKNKKEARLPLHDDLAATLRAMKPDDAAPQDRVFAELRRMRLFKLDLEAAGIPYTNGRGERADFHSLRHTCATLMNNAGVPFRVAMAIMRHSDPKLTAKVYTDQGQLDTAAAVARLPALGGLHSLIHSRKLGAAGHGQSTGWHGSRSRSEAATCWN